MGEVDNFEKKLYTCMMRTPTLNHYFEPKIMRIIIEIIR